VTGDAPRLLRLDGLTVSIRRRSGAVVPVQDVSLTARRGEVVGIVGESGCGKSTLLRAIAGVLPRGAAATTGTLSIAGAPVELGSVSPHVGMVFQDPMTCLNPVRTVGEQVCEVPRRRDGVSKSRAREMAVSLLAEVGISDAERRLDYYPHQLSGGLRQRVLIAAALSGNPELLLCDEPTTALDVTVQAQFVTLLQRLVGERGLGIVYVTHDLPLLGTISDSINVMYAGQIVERGTTQDVLESPAHPYTSALLEAAPRIDQRSTRLHSIPGRPPILTAGVAGCRFANRCGYATPGCSTATGLPGEGTDHESACVRAAELAPLRQRESA
jgi:oligopeptide/dipeptide ABC transporter ATP-binding protein